MKFLKTLKIPALLVLIAAMASLVSCNKDDDGPEPTGTQTEYTLSAVGNSGVSGTATFELLDNDATRITLSLTGTSSGGDHPSHIHINSAAEGGSIALDLTNVDGASGSSVTEVTALNDGTPVSYEELTEFDGYINVHTSSSDLGTLIAQGDIGQNVLTGESEAYDISEVGGSGLSGTATFSERVSGETLVVISLEGDDAESNHPVHIHMNTAAEGGGIAVDLTNIVAGASKTNIAALNDETAVTYDDLIGFDGYINIHNSPEDLGTTVAQGDIGQNALTGESEVYTLNEVDVAGVTGTATFSERVNGETLVTVQLAGVDFVGGYASHIHAGSAAEGGGIIISLNNVSASGIARTNVTMLNDASPIDYAGMIAIDGYLNVHTLDFSGLVAQGNVGVNAGDGGGNTAINYDVTNNGMTAYVFNGNGLTNEENPDFTLKRGETYTFTVSASGHPFWIKSTQGTGDGNAYSTGVTNNGTQSGTITFEVPGDAPDQLFYNCEFHAVMTGTITITD